uniref:DUF3752 domain-containing protein n=1 Tax=Peronospora matthiolae TaxID=2874970 RepID=A0AAV1VLD3_9STRA
MEAFTPLLFCQLASILAFKLHSQQTRASPPNLAKRMQVMTPSTLSSVSLTKNESQDTAPHLARRIQQNKNKVPPNRQSSPLDPVNKNLRTRVPSVLHLSFMIEERSPDSQLQPRRTHVSAVVQDPLRVIETRELRCAMETWMMVTRATRRLVVGINKLPRKRRMTLMQLVLFCACCCHIMATHHRQKPTDGFCMAKHEPDRERDRPRERQKRQKRRREDEPEPKKKKGKKQHKKDRKSGRSHERSRDDGDAVTEPDYAKALHVVHELLTQTPEITKDLLALLQMVDDGEVAVIGGIENRHIRSKLKELCPLLGLVKVRGPKDAFAKPRQAQDGTTETSVMEIFRQMLQSGSAKEVSPRPDATTGTDVYSETMSTAEVMEPAVQAPSWRKLPIGPSLPPASTRLGSIGDIHDVDDDEVVGPALPGMKGFRLADERTEAEMARQAEQLEKEQWERVRDGSTSHSAGADEKNPLVREAWMTVMPESSILKDSLGPQSRPPGKPAAFRRKEPAAVDKTWFDSPQERERAKRAKLDMELLGYIREENAPSAEAVRSVASTSNKAVVNESIVPTANPEADEEMRLRMENLRQSRGPSLLEKHQRKQAEQAQYGSQSGRSSGGWNRDRDLTARRGMSGDDAERMITAAKQINSKFTAPTISRHFL